MSTKSTTVRLMLRLGLQVAPAWMEARAAELFLTPRRRPTAAPALSDGTKGTRGSVRVAGEEVVFWSFGEGPAVLLVHGWEGRAQQLVPFAEPLVATGHRALLLELPAHGNSTGKTTHVPGAAEAMKALTNLVGPMKGVIAHSMGGAAALLAQLDHAFAERIALIAPAAEPAFFARRAIDFLGVPEAAGQNVLRRIEARVGRRFEEVDLRHRAAALRTPVLVLHDPDDQEVPYAHGEAAAKVSAKGTIERIPGAGHRRILKDPRAITKAVEFITGQPWPRQEPAAETRLAWENRSGTA